MASDLSALYKGLKLHARFHDDQWYLAEVVDIKRKNAKALVKVHWSGYGEDLEEWVGLDRLRSKALRSAGEASAPALPAAAPLSAAAALKSLEKGMRLQAQFTDGEWYVAEVLGVKKSKVQVHFLGYGAESDEWVGLDRLRSKVLRGLVAAEPAPQKKAAPKAAAGKATAKAAAKASAKAAAQPAAPKAAPKAGGAPKPSASASGPSTGATVHALYEDGTWYRAEVVQVSTAAKRAAAPIKIRYTDFGPESDEWVAPESLWPQVLLTGSGEAKAGKAKAKAKATAAPGQADLPSLLPVGTVLTAFAEDGNWYKAEVIQVSSSAKKAAAPIKVRFSGYGPELDEWVGADRIRSKALKGGDIAPKAKSRPARS